MFNSKELFENLKRVIKEIDPNIEVFPTQELEEEMKQEANNNDELQS